MKNESGFTRSWLFVLAVVLGLMVPARGFSASTTCGWNVNSFLNDTDNNNTALQLQSDGIGAYVTYGSNKGSKDSVLSVIQGNSCDWLLDVGSSLSRKVKLTLAYPASTVSPTPPPPFTVTENIAARIISICSENPLNNGITYGKMTTVGQTAQCGLHIAFDYNGNSYGLHLNPTNLAGTTWIQATCTGVSSGLCNTWTATPLPAPNNTVNPATNQNSGIGELFLVAKSGQRTPIAFYYVSFSALISK